MTFDRLTRFCWKSAACVASAGLAFASTGCADKRGGPISYLTPLGTPDAPNLAPLEATYRIAPMDTLSVKVFKMPDLSGDYEVDLTGQISMPLIGNVMAADLTTAQLDETLKRRLGEKYLENPDVSVGIKSSTRRNVTIDGSVTHAGSFPIAGPTTLMQVVALAGGTGPDANPRRTAIFRQVGGKRQAAAFDLTAIRRGQEPDPQVYAGDIVIIDGSSTKAAQKQILNSLPILSIFRPF
ncbi:MAG: polysaccharide biosynthesis/export family protein [Sphingomicrobium sp.]